MELKNDNSDGFNVVISDLHPMILFFYIFKGNYVFSISNYSILCYTNSKMSGTL